MANGSKLNTIRSLLIDINGKILKHPTFMKSGGSLPEEPGFHRDADEISSLIKRVEVALRELKNYAAMLDLSQQQAFVIPREQRWRHRQSVTDRGDNLKEVYDIATNTLASLQSLDARNARWPIADMIAYMIEKSAENTQVTQEILSRGKGHDASISVAQGPVQNVPVELILAMIGAYLIRLSTSRADK